jgi:RNA polymerase sigma-B factor
MTTIALDVDELHRRYAATRAPALRAALVERHQGLAQSIAYRFCQHKHDVEDRNQVALLGLLNAIDRFDPTRGVSFSTFAWATITGELKRFHRNSGWAAHVPRSMQELHLRTAAAVDHLTNELGRSPTLKEIADLTGDTEEAVVEGLELNSVRQHVSLDAPTGEDSDETRHVLVESSVGAVEDKVDVATLLQLLPDRSREILRLRFVEDLSQSEIAARMGLSQMHISRLLAQALRVLRESGVADATLLN